MKASNSCAAFSDGQDPNKCTGVFEVFFKTEAPFFLLPALGGCAPKFNAIAFLGTGRRPYHTFTLLYFTLGTTPPLIGISDRWEGWPDSGPAGTCAAISLVLRLYVSSLASTQWCWRG